ncbi:hypothetical protein K469DRAFT_735099 [Zopfia rhizophila CBS 207.26]|uniref:Uncharacterized protein n=1 Tax=Zopfia rhizophila CBS 207.26 TaxID=1314779 RepID=A0A6A6ELJ1_9PEZI|nr:hypothetical protein K469DRAFT_735099 [Zopfia rhizophila CBS 207.26]
MEKVVSLGRAGAETPPFSKENALRSSSQGAFPHSFRYHDQLLDPRKDTRTYLKIDLQTPRLNKIHRYLWLAGLPRTARPLHRQRLLLRAIHLTESPDEHLVWHEACIFIKPAWFVCYKSDFRIAREAGLLPEYIEWDTWSAFMVDFSGRINAAMLHQVDGRYDYGELRLSRLNSLYRFGAATFSPQNSVYGSMSGSKRYAAFFEHNSGWILAVSAHITVVLPAMQVALATERLRDDVRFQSFSYGIALMSMAFVLIAVAIMLLVW